jgi:hypothetical protein
MEDYMDKALQIIDSLENIYYKHTLKDDNLIVIYDTNIGSLATLNLKEKTYFAQNEFFNTDIIRILNWFNWTYKTLELPRGVKCNGLGCENCSGCGYNSLTQLYNSKIILSKHIAVDILENYTFVGTLDIDNLPFPLSPFKKYINYENDYFKLWICDESAPNYNWSCQPIKNETFLSFLHIEQLIPELLFPPKVITKLYGIYNNSPVLWEYKLLNGRNQWIENILT